MQGAWTPCRLGLTRMWAAGRGRLAGASGPPAFLPQRAIKPQAVCFGFIYTTSMRLPPTRAVLFIRKNKNCPLANQSRKNFVSLHKISCTRATVSKFTCRSLAISLHKISCTRATVSKLTCRSLALSLHKTSCTRATVSKLTCRSLALSLHKTSCTHDAWQA